MKVLVFYRFESEHARRVEMYLEEMRRHHAVQEAVIEPIDVDTSEGDSRAKVYDIMAYPTFVAVDDRGGFMKMWSGELPLQNELMSYLFSS